MEVAEIDTGEEKFYCKSQKDLEKFADNNRHWLPPDVVINIKEMTEEEYNSIPATNRSLEAFK